MTREQARIEFNLHQAEMQSIADERKALVAHTDERFKTAKEKLDTCLEVIGEPHGNCETCGVPIFEGDKYGPCDDGIMLCQKHTFNLSDSLSQRKEMLASGELGAWDETAEEMRESIAALEADMAMNGDRPVLYIA